MAMDVRFWGVRGSYPVPGPSTNRFGGNTACVQVCPSDGGTIILDAGTGIRRLGHELMEGPAGQGEGEIHILVSHTHWDHIQGLPFFSPLYEAGNKIQIYGRQREVHLEDIFRAQSAAPYFSHHLDEVAARVSYVELIEGASFELGQVIVTCARLNHPDISIGYRLEADGATVAYVADTAPFDRILFEHQFLSSEPEAPPSSEEAAYLAELKQGVVNLCTGADLVIFDTMFSPQEYESRPHWGHATAQHAIELSQEAGASALALFHYSPTATDEQLDEQVKDLNSWSPIKVIASREVETVSL